MKTWHIVAIIAGAAVVLYLVTRKSPILVGAKPGSGSSAGSVLTGIGTAASGLSDLWESVSGSFGTAGKGDTESGGDAAAGGE